MEKILIEPRDGSVVSCLSNLLQTGANEALASGDTFKVGLSGEMSEINKTLLYSFRNIRKYDIFQGLMLTRYSLGWKFQVFANIKILEFIGYTSIEYCATNVFHLFPSQLNCNLQILLVFLY